MGKPVIATGYSGNLDFMNRNNSLLVEIREDGPIYTRGNFWAEPSVKQAAAYMREVFDHPTKPVPEPFVARLRFNPCYRWKQPASACALAWSRSRRLSPSSLSSNASYSNSKPVGFILSLSLSAGTEQF
jgi:hypothetical protein